jgi:hypothetical protein
MPRSGTGEYTTPPGVKATPGFTIESAKYNLNVDDVANDLNGKRPIVAGGTGASNINEAMVNLKGERSYQTIVNYDSDRFNPGSFKSEADALGAPIAGHAFAGICYTLDDPPNPSSAAPPNDDLTIEARDFNDTALPPHKYVRQKKAGVWSAWYTETVAPTGGLTDPSKVLKSGDSMTGPLILSGNPATGLQAATKAYVDSAVLAGGGGGGGSPPPSPSTSVPLIEAGSGAVGGSLAYARADHVHPALAGPTGVTPGTAIPLVESGTGNVGISNKYAREDHVHPQFGGGGATDPTKVLKAGDTMTGGLIIKTPNNTAMQLDVTSSGSRSIIGSKSMARRWHMEMGDSNDEFGGNTGSNFALARCTDLGAFMSYAIYVTRQTGEVTMAGTLFASDGPVTSGGPQFRVVNGQAYKPGGGVWLDSSDNRIKALINYYDYGLTQIKALQPIRFKYKGNDVPLDKTATAAPEQPDPNSPHYAAAQAGTVYTGLFAQEAETVMPEMVSQTSMQIDGVAVNDMRILDTSSLIFCLINAVKQLAARVEALEAAP